MSEKTTSKDKNKYQAEYRKEKTKQLLVRFYGSDMELFDYAKNHSDGTFKYIKGLIRADMIANGYEFGEQDD